MKTKPFPYSTPLKTLSLLAARVARGLAACVLATATVRAATDTWVGNTSPNWNNNLNWSPANVPAANDQLSFVAAGTAGAWLTNDLASGLIFNGITFQTAASAYSISGNPIGLNGGITNASPNTQVISNAIALQANGAVNATGPVTLAGAASGAFALTKTGTNMLALAGANTYSGPTTLSAGTLQLTGSDNRLLTNSSVAFAGTSALIVDGISQTLASATFPNIPMTATVSGGGSLMVNGAANLEMGPGGTVSPTTNITVNMGGLNSFTYDAPANTFRVGLKSGAQNSAALDQVATVTLATNNTIRASTLAVGDVAANNDGGAQTLHLGPANLVKVNSINVGASGRSDATLDFAAGLTAPTVTIRNTDGSSPVTSWNVGRVTQTSGGQLTFGATVDVSLGTLDAVVTTMLLGAADAQTSTGRRGTENGALTMGAGTLTVTNLTIGQITGQSSSSLGAAFSGSGTVSLNNAGGTLNATTINLAENTIQSSGAFTKTVTGTINLNGGTIKAQTIQKGPQTGTATTVTPTLNWNDGTVANYDAATDLTIGSGINIRLAATGNHSFNIGAGRSATVGAVLVNASSGGTLIKTGPGTLILTNANTYTGSTTISNGTLALGASAALSSGTINVAGNALFDVSAASAYSLNSGQILAGIGSVKGNVTAASGAQISPAGVGVPGTLTLSNGLSLNGPTLVLDLSSTPAGGNDQIKVGGALTLNANTTIAVTELASSLGAGTYTLMTYASINTNTFSFVLSAPRGTTLNVGATALTLTASPASGANLIWVGDGVLNNWDSQTTTNWLNGASLDFFYQNDNVTFDDTGSVSPAVNLTTTLFPNGVTVNAAQSYTFSGPGQLAGAMSLTKNGAGTLTLSNANAFSGSTTIGAGTLTIGEGAQLGGGVYAGNITNNGLLIYNSSAAQTLSGNISGTGTLNQQGAGTLTLSGANSYSGGTLDTGGDILASANNALGIGDVTLNSATNARILLGGGVTITNALVFNAGSGGIGNGILQSASTTASGTWSGPIVLNANAAAGGHFRGPTTSGLLAIAGPVTTGGAATAVAVRDGFMRFSGGGSYPAMNLTATTSLGANNGIATNCVMNIAASAAGTLDLNGYNQTLAGLINNNANRGWVTNSAATPSTLTLAGPGMSSYSGSIVGNVAVNLVGGTQVYAGSATAGNALFGYSGDTTITNGTLQLAAANLLPNGAGRGNLIVTNAGVLDLNTFSQTINGLFGNGTIDTVGGGTPTLTVGNNNADGTFGGVLQNTGGTLALTKSGAGTLTLAGTNTYAGGTTIAGGGGKLRITNPNALGSGTVTISKGGTVTGTLQLVLTGANTIANPFGGFASTSFSLGDATVPCIENVAGTNTITSDVTITTTGGNGVSVQSDADLIELAGTIGTTRTDSRGLLLNGAGNGLVSGSVSGGSSPVFFVQKNGTGTWTLSGLNTYGGNTVVNSGRLALGASAYLASPTINVASNAVFDVSAVSGYTLNFGQALGGNGSVNGGVAAASGAQISPGGAGAPGTLTFSNALSLSGPTLVLDLSTNPAGGNDQINVGGAVTLNANTTISVSQLAGFLGAGTYTLMTYPSINTNSFSFVLLGVRNATLNVGATALTLTASGVGANLKWVGDGILNNWDTQITPNWLNGTNLDFFYQTDAVTFDDTGSASPAVNLTTTLNPSSVTVNAAQNYTFNGPGQLAGAMSLTKNGTGTLTLSGSNVFSGSTTIGAGTLTIDGVGQLGGGNYAANITNNGAFNYASSANQTFSGSISGTGSLTDSGGGTVTLLGTNTYTGDTAISAGTLTIGGGGQLGGGAYAGNIADYGAFNHASSASQTLFGIISGAGSLTKSGTNTLTLSGANTYFGGTTISAGTLQLTGGNDRLPNTGSVAFTGNSTIDLGSISQTVSSLTFPNTTMTATMLGGGAALTVNGAADLQIGPGGALASTTTTIVNLGGLLNFTFDAPANTLRVGLKSGASNSGALDNVATVTLATNNTIRASLLALGDVSASSDGGISTLHLGATNLLEVDSINLGYSGRSDVTLNFAAGLSNPAVKIRNTDGTSAVTSWNIGRVSQFTGAAQTTFGATVDVSPGTFDALVTTMLLGAADATTQTTRRGTQSSTFTMGTGKLTVGTLTIGKIAGQAGSSLGAAFTGNGTFTMSNSGGVLNATTINLAENTILSDNPSAFGESVTGTINLGAGTIKAQTIQLGAQTGTASSVTAALNWTNGTIKNFDAGTDLTLTGLTSVALIGAGSHNFDIDSGRLGTVNPAISGTGALTKAGLGKLMLGGANTYTGNTTVNAGTLEIAQATIAANSTVTVAASAMLQLDFAETNTVAGLVLNGAIQPAGVYNNSTTAAYISGQGSLLVSPTVATNSPVLTNSISGNTLTLSWPADHLGWRLQVQTNLLSTGLATNWVTWPNSTNLTSVPIVLDSANPTVFFRLVYP